MSVSNRVVIVAGGACAVAGCLFPALSDLSGADAGATGDASDGGIASDVVAPNDFCATVDATFCEDFDEPDGAYLARWSTFDLGTGNTIALESDATTSAPNALVVEIPGGATGGASIWKDLPPTATTYDYSFSLRLEPYDAGAGSVLFNQIEVDSTDASAAYEEFRFEQFANSTRFSTHTYYPDGGNTVLDVPLSITLAPGQWYRVEEQLTVDPPPAKVVVFVDGSPVLSTTIAPATNGAGTSEFLAGIYHTNGPTGTWRIEVDDVVMRAK